MLLSSMGPTIYVITYHAFNHKKGKLPIDRRFFDQNRHYVFYHIDKETPDELKDQKTLSEYAIDPALHEAGAKYFGEWSFLLAEEKHAFCSYPFFMISSRFYQKNQWLKYNLNEEWDSLFSYFNNYRFGYLPSYNRPARWVSLEWERHLKNKAWKYKFFPFSGKTYQLIEEIYKVKIPCDYRLTADFFCNYIGFRSRRDLLDYVSFYKSIIDFFFDSDYQIKRPLEPYVYSTGNFRNEKAFTFLLEHICHLYFFQRKEMYFALHYDGYYEIAEHLCKMKKLVDYSIDWKTEVRRFFEWQFIRISTESNLCQYKDLLKKIPFLYQTVTKMKKIIS